ncbi:MAG: universal stress protein [Chloroflexota bacterium]|nr:universal stress protein [Chloroflexota bacterium]
MYKKILAPLDGSPLAECTLAHLKEVVTGCNIPEVVVLRVVEPLSSQTVAAYAEVGSGRDLLSSAEQQNREEARKYAAEVVEKLKKDGVAAEAVLVNGEPAEQILDYARKNQVDLIVMSTHGRSGISRWVMGSVADRVVRHAAIPVFLISPQGCRVSA